MCIFHPSIQFVLKLYTLFACLPMKRHSPYYRKVQADRKYSFGNINQLKFIENAFITIYTFFITKQADTNLTRMMNKYLIKYLNAPRQLKFQLHDSYINLKPVLGRNCV